MQKIVTAVVLSYLRFFARLALTINHPKVIGITGSAGKSSTRNAITAVLEKEFKTKTIEKGNSETGIPLGILGLKVDSLGFNTPLKSFFDWLKLLLLSPFGIFYLKGVEYLIIEMGIDEPEPPKNMSYLLTIVKPNISIFINAHPVHAQQFEAAIPNLINLKNLSDEQKLDLVLNKIAEEKGKIITENDKCEYAIFNQDNDYVREAVNKNKNARIKYYSFGEGSSNQLRHMDYSATTSGSKFSFFSNLTKNKYDIHFDRFLLPEVYNQGIASAILVGEILGVDRNKVRSHLERDFEIPEGRSSLFKGINNTVIIDSSYNASKAPNLAFLDLVEMLKKKEKREVVFVMGDMRELGGREKSEHEIVGQRVFEVVDYLYCVGPLTKEFIVDNHKFKEQRKKLKVIKWFDNSVKAGKYLKNKLPKNAIVLVKGSQNTIFTEETVKQLLKNERDVEKLCRQDEYWMKQKEYLFK